MTVRERVAVPLSYCSERQRSECHSRYLAAYRRLGKLSMASHAEWPMFHSDMSF